MSTSVRKSGGRDELDAFASAVNQSIADVLALVARVENSALTFANIAAGTTAGKIKAQTACPFRIAGRIYSKAVTDDLWNLTGQAATDSTHYRAIWLYLDASGTASIVAGTDATSSALAIAALPAQAASKSVIGVYIAGLSTDFTAALTGTFVNGYAAAQSLTGSTIAQVAL